MNRRPSPSAAAIAIATRRPVATLALSLAVLLSLRSGPAQAAETPPAGHDAAAHGASGIKKELIEGITAEDFLRLGDTPKTVRVTVVSAFDAANHGMNFNGFSHGKAVYTIPTGWKVEVTFINPSPVPHSAIVVERDVVKKLQMGTPAFTGGSVPNPAQGMSLRKASFSFVADTAGDYAIACGFPAHALSGHWVAFNVRDDAPAPTLKLGDAEARVAK